MRQGRPRGAQMTFDADKRADGWYVLAGDTVTYKPRVVKVFPLIDGDRAKEAAALLTHFEDPRRAWTQSEITRLRQLLLPGRQRPRVDELVALCKLIYGIPESFSAVSIPKALEDES